MEDQKRSHGHCSYDRRCLLRRAHCQTTNLRYNLRHEMEILEQEEYAC